MDDEQLNISARKVISGISRQRLILRQLGRNPSA